VALKPELAFSKFCLITINKNDLGRLLSLFGVTPLEAFDAARRVYQLLFAGIERMADGTNFDVEFFLGRLRRPRRATGANDVALLVFRMNICFHFDLSL
jgi:hypothetical protein